MDEYEPGFIGEVVGMYAIMGHFILSSSIAIEESVFSPPTEVISEETFPPSELVFVGEEIKTETFSTDDNIVRIRITMEYFFHV